jgi:hypothetical protein
MAEWDVLLKDQHEGYISWSEFERNQQVIADNATGKGGAAVRGAVRRGELLLAGLLRCGHCGRKLYVGYGGKAGRYYCSRQPRSEPILKSVGLHLKRRLRLSHDRGPTSQHKVDLLADLGRLGRVAQAK